MPGRIDFELTGDIEIGNWEAILAPVAKDGLEVVQGKEDIEVVKGHDMKQTS